MLSLLNSVSEANISFLTLDVDTGNERKITKADWLTIFRTWVLAGRYDLFETWGPNHYQNPPDLSVKCTWKLFSLVPYKGEAMVIFYSIQWILDFTHFMLILRVVRRPTCDLFTMCCWQTNCKSENVEYPVLWERYRDRIMIKPTLQ